MYLKTAKRRDASLVSICLHTPLMLCVYLWPPSEFCQRPSEADLLCQGYNILSLSQGRHCQQEEKDRGELMGIAKLC